MKEQINNRSRDMEKILRKNEKKMQGIENNITDIKNAFDLLHH